MAAEIFPKLVSFSGEKAGAKLSDVVLNGTTGIEAVESVVEFDKVVIFDGVLFYQNVLVSFKPWWSQGGSNP